MEESLVRYSKLSIITATNRFNICREEAIMQLEGKDKKKKKKKLKKKTEKKEKKKRKRRKRRKKREKKREQEKIWKWSRYDSLSRVCGFYKHRLYPGEAALRTKPWGPCCHLLLSWTLQATSSSAVHGRFGYIPIAGDAPQHDPSQHPSGWTPLPCPVFTLHQHRPAHRLQWLIHQLGDVNYSSTSMKAHQDKNS